MHFLVLFHTFMGKSKTFSNFDWCSGWNNGVMGSWTTWFLDFKKRGAWNKRGAAKFGLFLMNVVAEIRDLWVENFQKINCRDVTSIWKGKVGLDCKRHFFSSKLCKYWKLLCCDKWHPGTVMNTDTIKNSSRGTCLHGTTLKLPLLLFDNGEASIHLCWNGW